MKKFGLFFSLVFILFLGFGFSSFAADSVTFIEPSYKGMMRFKSPFPTVSSATWDFECTYQNYDFGYLTYRIPVADVPLGSYFLLEFADSDVFFNASFFWCSSLLSQSCKLPYDSVVLLSPSGYPDSSLNRYDSDFVKFDEVNVERTSGYYYITAAVLRGNTLLNHDFTLKLVTPGEPEPEPDPDPDVPDLGDVGSASSELGTFGTDDGTQNDVFTAFKRLYDSLLGIMSDDSVPDDYADNIATTVVNPSSSAPTLFAADDFTATSRAAPGEYSEAAVIVSKYRATAGETVMLNDYVDISPYNVEIVESSPVQGQGYREGNFYALYYRMELPFRFVFSGHKGTATCTPQFFLDLSASYRGASAITGTYQYGTPAVYLLPDNVAYDMSNTFEPVTGELIRDTISGTIGFKPVSIPVVNNLSDDGYRIVIEFPLYIYESGAFVEPNSFTYETRVSFNRLTYNAEPLFNHTSDYTPNETLDDIYEEQKNQNQLENDRYQEEQDKTQEAADSVTDGLGTVTDTLSSWEIITMPVTLMSDFLSAITSSGSTVFTFPSFSVMGQTLWPSYSFDLSSLTEKFSVLFNTLHLISGILIVIWFVRYLWRKWAVITGDDLPMGEED